VRRRLARGIRAISSPSATPLVRIKICWPLTDVCGSALRRHDTAQLASALGEGEVFGVKALLICVGAA